MILSAAPETLKRLKKPGRRERSRVKIGSGPADARRKLSVKADSSLCRTLRVRRTRVRQRLGKQNPSDPLIQKGSEGFGHTLGVYLGARMDA